MGALLPRPRAVLRGMCRNDGWCELVNLAIVNYITSCTGKKFTNLSKYVQNLGLVTVPWVFSPQRRLSRN